MAFIETAKEVITNPTGFFTGLKEEGTMSAWVYYAIGSAILTLFSLIIGVIFSFGSSELAQLGELGIPMAGSTFLIGASIAGYLIGLGLIFIYAAISHLFLMIVGAKGSYSDTFQVYSYANTPSFAFGWIPFIGGLFGIWTLILAVIGASIKHKISILRAVVALVLIPLAIFIVIFGMAALLLGAAVFAMFGNGGASIF